VTSFDVVVIGAGPGGYVAAIRCAQLGLKTACVDEWRTPADKPALGGTCLNVGCIPSKALLESSEQYYRVTHELADQGILTKGVELDLATMQARKDKVVSQMTGGIELLFKKNKIIWHQGRARLTGPKRIEVLEPGGEAVAGTLEARQVIIATGSEPTLLPFAAVDGDRIVDSAGALSFDAVPKRLGVIGAGIIAMELGSVWRRLGAEVTCLELLDVFLPMVDTEVARHARREFDKLGIEVRLGAKVTEVKATKKQVKVIYSDANGEHDRVFDKVLVAAGRRPFTQGLNLAAAGLGTDKAGRIEVDAHCRTSVDGIYAIGDVVRGPMLAHKAEEEGIMVAELIAGQRPELDLSLVPGVMYTWPEVAWVGKSSQELDAEGIEYRAGSFPFRANGRAWAMNNPFGLVKIMADARSDAILGVHIIGPSASELIAEAVVVMEFGGSAEDLARTVHAHPTLSEAVREAALAVDKRAIHI
jgi:dihydrolipoamide dehydrogenase